MPNWMHNELTVVCESEKIAKKYYELFKSENREFDFNKIIPMPKQLDVEMGSSGERGLYYLYTKASEEDRKIIDKAYRSCNPFNKHIYEDYNDNNLEKYEEFANDGVVYLNNFKETGFCRSYNWCCYNWGTKWNSVDSSAQLNGREIKYVFETAWSDPVPIFIKIADLEGVLRIQERFVEENMISNGQYEIQHNDPAVENNFRRKIADLDVVLEI